MEPQDPCATPAEKLDKVYKGILTDILTAQQALALEAVIGKNAGALNSTRYRSLFGQLQQIFIRDATLAVCRLFESERDYALRNIPAALEVLDKHRPPPAIHRPSLEQRLSKFAGKDISLDGLSETEITALITMTFHDRLPTSKSNPLGDAWTNLKWRRDKTVAHHEAVDCGATPPLTHKGMDDLITYAKHFAGIIGSVYLSSNPYLMLGEIDKPGDMEMVGKALQRLMQDAGLLAPPNAIRMT